MQATEDCISGLSELTLMTTLICSSHLLCWSFLNPRRAFTGPTASYEMAAHTMTDPPPCLTPGIKTLWVEYIFLFTNKSYHRFNKKKREKKTFTSLMLHIFHQGFLAWIHLYEQTLNEIKDCFQGKTRSKQVLFFFSFFNVFFFPLAFPFCII